MIFWVAVLVMLAGAILSVLLPLARRSTEEPGVDPQIALYRDQLLQFDEREDAGTAEEERAEIARRLLEASERSETSKAPGPGSWSVRIAAMLALVLLPAFSLSMYWVAGSPLLATAPEPVNVARTLENRSVEDLVAIAERQLQDHPNDIRGWSLLADVYGRMNQPAKRAHALRQILRIRGASADLLADIAEAVVFQNSGAITAEALSNFEQAVALEPGHQKAAAYLAIALEQEGKPDEALARWTALAQSAELVGDRRLWVKKRIATLENQIANRSAPAPNREQLEDAASLSSQDRATMIRGMVERLSERLEEDPDDFEGWLRLIRSRHVLGDRNELDAAWQRAKNLFATDQDKQQRLAALADEIGYDPGSRAPNRTEATQ